MSSEKLTEAEQSVISALSRAVNRGRQSMAATLAAAEAKLFPGEIFYYMQYPHFCLIFCVL
jgi:hypothetical protein